MSLDVYLIGDKPIKKVRSSGIFIRENGQTREITEEEWYEKSPGREPVRFRPEEDETTELYHSNITHNLAKMADAARIYTCLWHPDHLKIKKAKDLILPLKNGLDRLTKAPAKFKKYNPENGWGDYDGLVGLVYSYLGACIMNPEATVEVSI